MRRPLQKHPLQESLCPLPWLLVFTEGKETGRVPVLVARGWRTDTVYTEDRMRPEPLGGMMGPFPFLDLSFPV